MRYIEKIALLWRMFCAAVLLFTLGLYPLFVVVFWIEQSWEWNWWLVAATVVAVQGLYDMTRAAIRGE